MIELFEEQDYIIVKLGESEGISYVDLLYMTNLLGGRDSHQMAGMWKIVVSSKLFGTYLHHVDSQ